MTTIRHLDSQEVVRLTIEYGVQKGENLLLHQIRPATARKPKCQIRDEVELWQIPNQHGRMISLR